jgi:hypothetical protein|tara:strand:+ start:13760 stop:13993 length:234 start_codon:yes stop_codon:yes gene_type:complete
MKFTKFIDVKVFLLALFAGLFLSYILSPKKRVIYVYPNPSNTDKLRYKDKAGNCFKFQQNEVECPANKNDIEEYKVQ